MKKNVSTKFIILLPVFILGIVSVLSNIVAVINIKRVNNNATQIANGYSASQNWEISRRKHWTSTDWDFPILLQPI